MILSCFCCKSIIVTQLYLISPIPLITPLCKSGICSLRYLVKTDDNWWKDMVTDSVTNTPFKVLALEALPQFLPGKNASIIPNILLPSIPRASDPIVVELLVVIHPDRGHPLVVVLGQLHRGRPLVRRECPEDVSNPAARNNLNLAPTHPSLRVRQCWNKLRISSYLYRLPTLKLSSSCSPPHISIPSS